MFAALFRQGKRLFLQCGENWHRLRTRKGTHNLVHFEVIGGWGYGTVVRQHPNREIDFDCACVACVRAKLRVRDDSAVARVGRTNLSVVQPSGRPAVQPSGQPAVRHPRSRDTFFASGLGLSEDVQLSLTSVFVYRSR